MPLYSRTTYKAVSYTVYRHAYLYSLYPRLYLVMIPCLSLTSGSSHVTSKLVEVKPVMRTLQGGPPGFSPSVTNWKAGEKKTFHYLFFKNRTKIILFSKKFNNNLPVTLCRLCFCPIDFLQKPEGDTQSMVSDWSLGFQSFDPAKYFVFLEDTILL